MRAKNTIPDFPVQANAASKRLLSAKFSDVEIALEGAKFSFPDPSEEGGIVDFEVDGLLVGSKGCAIVESKTALAASHITDIVRTGRLVKKYCRQLGLSTAHAQVLDQSNLINILACPAVSESLLSKIANRDPGICVLADCGGSFELVRDFDGQLRTGPANPGAAAER